MVHDIAQLLSSLIGLDFSVWQLPLTVLVRFMAIALCFAGGISLLAMFSIWWERKVAGHIQGRFGPMHVGGWHGWAQSLADGIKLVLKEDLIPQGADRWLFKLAPYLAFAPVFAAFLALPFGPQLVFEDSLSVGVLYLLAVLGVEVMGVILAGWSSNSKWSLYGAMREACQMVSYEIPLGLSIICGVLTAGTLNLVTLSYLQGTGWGMRDWFIFHNPFMFAAFVVYFIASLASNKRAPFDLPESESELVAGFHTEYSGIRWSFFFFAEYGAMFVVGAIQTTLFLGGWNSPFGSFDFIYAILGYDPAVAHLAYASGTLGTTMTDMANAMGLSGPLSLILLNLYCFVWFIIKTMSLMFVQIWMRWTLPRIRIDQVLYTCVKVLLPISLVLLLGNACWLALVPQAAGPQGPTPLLQLATQWVLVGLGLSIVGFCVGVVIWAFLTRHRHPPQSFFTDVMPVGRTIPFTTPLPPLNQSR